MLERDDGEKLQRSNNEKPLNSVKTKKKTQKLMIYLIF